MEIVGYLGDGGHQVVDGLFTVHVIHHKIFAKVTKQLTVVDDFVVVVFIFLFLS